MLSVSDGLDEDDILDSIIPETCVVEEGVEEVRVKEEEEVADEESELPSGVRSSSILIVLRALSSK